MSAPRILFVTDAGPKVGGGHVMRSLTLADALADAGAACAFTATADNRPILDAFAPAMTRAAMGDPFDAVVFDHYGLDAVAHRQLSGGRPTLVIDDLADRPLAADLVLDSGPARTAADYAGLVPETCRLLLGPTFAPVRPAFAALRPGVLARRTQEGAVRRVLVSCGLTDVGAVTARVVRAILPHLGAAALDVAAGAGAPSRDALSALAAQGLLTLHIDSRDMPALTAVADLAVGAGGSTAWERCTLGLPTLHLVLADNQRPAAQALAALGAAQVLDVAAETFDCDLAQAFAILMRDEDRRKRMSQASAAVCDGLGAARAAAAFLALI